MSRFSPPRFSLSLIAAFGYFLSGCGSAPHAISEKYYLIVPNAKSPYWAEASAGLARAAADLHVTASMTGPGTYSPDQQLAEFQRIAASKPAGILVSVSNPQVIGPAIDAAIAQGIPVITIDSDAPGSKRLTFVGTNNYEVGLMGGRAIAARLNGKGNLLVFTTAGQPNLEERLRGYRAALEAFPGVRILDVVDIQGDPGRAFDRVSEGLAKAKQEVDGYVSLEGQSARDIADVLSRRKVTGKVVISMDSLEPTLAAIDQGLITGTIAQKPYTMAYLGVRLLADLHLHKLRDLSADHRRDPHGALPAFIDTGSAWIEKSNLAAYRDSLREAKATPAN